MRGCTGGKDNGTGGSWWGVSRGACCWFSFQIVFLFLDCWSNKLWGFWSCKRLDQTFFPSNKLALHSFEMGPAFAWPRTLARLAGCFWLTLGWWHQSLFDVWYTRCPTIFRLVEWSGAIDSIFFAAAMSYDLSRSRAAFKLKQLDMKFSFLERRGVPERFAGQNVKLQGPAGFGNMFLSRWRYQEWSGNIDSTYLLLKQCFLVTIPLWLWNSPCHQVFQPLRGKMSCRWGESTEISSVRQQKSQSPMGLPPKRSCKAQRFSVHVKFISGCRGCGLSLGVPSSWQNLRPFAGSQWWWIWVAMLAVGLAKHFSNIRCSVGETKNSGSRSVTLRVHVFVVTGLIVVRSQRTWCSRCLTQFFVPFQNILNPEPR